MTEPTADPPERDLGVIQGREVYPGDPDHPTEPGRGRFRRPSPPPPPPDWAAGASGPVPPPGTDLISPAEARGSAAFQAWLKELRASRKNVPNSRPLPAWVERLAWILDSVFEIPGTRRRVGIDGMLTFIPVIGDAAGLTLSMIVVAAGIAAGVSSCGW